MTEQDVTNKLTALEAQLADRAKSETAAAYSKLATYHITVSAGLLVILALILAIGGWFAAHSMQSYEAALAKQESRYEDLQKQLAAGKAETQADTKQQQVIVKVIHDRDQQADQKIAQVTAPDKTAQQAATDMESAYGFKAVVDDAKGTLGLTTPEAQVVTSTKIDRDRLSLDLTDTRHNLDLETSKDNICEVSLQKSNDALNGYRKVANKGKLKRAWDAAKNGAGGVVIGIIIKTILH